MRDFDYVKSLYEKLRRQHPNDTVRQLGWDSVESQQRGYDAIYHVADKLKIDFMNRVVHDAGCGYAGIRSRVVERGGTYFGTDVSTAIVAELGSRGFGVEEIARCDLLTDEIQHSGITICCGTLAAYTGDDVYCILSRLWESTHEALIFTSWWHVADTSPFYDRMSGVRKAVHKFFNSVGSRHYQTNVAGVPNEIVCGIVR